MKQSKIGAIVGIGSLGCLLLIVCGLGIGRWQIQSALETWCETAQAAHPHPGDSVAALMDYVQVDSHPLSQRNLAVWALGQARDVRALPVLEGYHTGRPCDHQNDLCQRELAKAIELCRIDAPNPLFIRTPKRQ